VKDLAHILAEKYYGVAQGELLVGGVPIQTLAQRYGTPAFFYDRSTIDKKLDALKAALPSRFSVSYSVKANPNSAIVRYFVSHGCGLEIASSGELAIALEAGCKPERVLFAGPGKTEAELEFALSREIGEIHLESLTEIKRVAAISRRLGFTARVAIRVNPGGQAEGGAMRMGGRSAPFGVDEEILHEVMEAVLRENNLEFLGFHIFSGTQILDAKIVVGQYRHGLEIAKRVTQWFDRPIKTLDFGGGLGIPYFAQDKDLDLDELHSGLADLFDGVEHEAAFRDTQFVVEPGRFLVGEAGIYVARINDIKTSRGKKFLILDGGMNHHLAASGNLGQTIKRNYPVALLNKMDAPASDTVDVVGPLCTPLDTVARNALLPQAEIGDLFGIFQSGAYGRSASPLGFLSHPAPPEIWIDSGHDLLVSPREERAATAHHATVVQNGVRVG
jgi:diaminopimelate decarboxylase